jgi:hypothetical protein
METRHIKKRIFARAASTGVTTLCGAPVGKKAWLTQDARNLLRFADEGRLRVREGYGKTWEFCPDCKEKL